ncbi:serine protease [Paenibacillus hexagrammi]|uniref:Serine protease n=1 Tax=Paenibacillus hexagrammi TaxID=2908839 RepID=A0ABY3SFJ2_9BACL|nr:serine protease [Paenibacillus sp. YPD9-1]UJF32210.1 serine protease [Paenibacillus sp. YPD9-1]
MRYFQITEDERILNAAKPMGITDIPKEMLTRERVHELDDWLLQFQVREQPGGGRFVDFIERPIPLYSEPFKRHLEKCSKQLHVQPVVLTDLKHLKQESYWLVVPPVVHCVSEQSEFRKDGTLQQLVIQEEQIRHPFFKVGGLLEDVLVVDLAMAESILRRGLTGMRFKRLSSVAKGKEMTSG